MNKKQKKMLIRIIISAVLMIALYIAYSLWGGTVKEPLWFFLYMIPYLVIGYDILKKAGKGIINRQMFDENFLIPGLCCGKEQEKHQRAHGYTSRLCQC